MVKSLSIGKFVSLPQSNKYYNNATVALTCQNILIASHTCVNVDSPLFMMTSACMTGGMGYYYLLYTI